MQNDKKHIYNGLWICINLRFVMRLISQSIRMKNAYLHIGFNMLCHIVTYGKVYISHGKYKVIWELS